MSGVEVGLQEASWGRLVASWLTPQGQAQPSG